MPTKRCPQCRTTKDLAAFGRNSARGDGLSAQCKACRADQARRRYAANPTRFKAAERDRYARNRAIMDNAKAKPCADCGVQYPSYVMEFDHLGDEPKEFDVCKGRFTSVERLMAEIAKCAVVCANCHRVRTWKRRQAAYAIERVG